ncbi:hypothetical protein ACOMHN_057066 [Nucella lapillus]
MENREAQAPSAATPSSIPVQQLAPETPATLPPIHTGSLSAPAVLRHSTAIPTSPGFYSHSAPAESRFQRRGMMWLKEKRQRRIKWRQHMDEEPKAEALASLQPLRHEKVGLKNAGATCYMNAVLQQANGRLVTDAKRKAELLDHQFQTAFSEGKQYFRDEYEEKCGTQEGNFLVLDDLEVTEEGVHKLLKNLKPNKASGPDEISSRILKELSTELAPALTTIFRSSLSTGQVPSDWRDALVSPIFKKGEHYNPANYRPVSLTCIVCKLLEHIVVHSLMKHLETNEILCHQQHGFRKNRSCETQLLELVEELTSNMVDGLQTDMVILDFAKAFDKVNHSLLLHKIHDYGIKGKTNKWIKSFLSNRRQAVVVDGEKAEFSSVKSGVPQGSVLGPCLFLVYINDLPKNLNSKVRIFADDTAIYSTITADADIKQLQNDLQNLEMSSNGEEQPLYYLWLLKETLLLHTRLQQGGGVCEPRGLWENYRLGNGVINPMEQQDAGEFLSSLVHSLDAGLAAMGEAPHLDMHFGGTTVHQKISLQCLHSHQREEKFIILNVDICNQNYLHNALDSYLKDELLEGANAYHCEACDYKVRLLLGLQGDMPRSLYRLRGIIVHRGDGQWGHYYSFIRHRGEKGSCWLKYDDEYITECDLTNDMELQWECFGGRYYDFQTQRDVLDTGCAELSPEMSLTQDCADLSPEMSLTEDCADLSLETS